MRQARLYASHSLEVHKQVGCVIANHSDVLSYGWNENLNNLPGFSSRGTGRAIHAEEAAILKTVNLKAVSLLNSSLFSTRAPCWVCAKMIVQVGIKEVFYLFPHDDEEEGINLLKLSGITVLKVA